AHLAQPGIFHLACQPSRFRGERPVQWDVPVRVPRLVHAFDHVARPQPRLEPVSAQPGKVDPRSYVRIAHRRDAVALLRERGAEPVPGGSRGPRGSRLEHLCECTATTPEPRPAGSGTFVPAV